MTPILKPCFGSCIHGPVLFLLMVCVECKKTKPTFRLVTTPAEV